MYQDYEMFQLSDIDIRRTNRHRLIGGEQYWGLLGTTRLTQRLFIPDQ